MIVSDVIFGNSRKYLDEMLIVAYFGMHYVVERDLEEQRKKDKEGGGNKKVEEDHSADYDDYMEEEEESTPETDSIKTEDYLYDDGITCQKLLVKGFVSHENYDKFTNVSFWLV